MVARILQLKTPNIIDVINGYHDESRFFSADDPRAAELAADINKVMNRDAADGWLLTGMLQTLLGDREKSEYAFRNRERIGVKDASFYSNWMASRMNLGMLSAAQELFRVVGSPEKGNLPGLFEMAIQAGAVEQAMSYAQDAQSRLKLPAAEIGDLEYGKALADSLAELEVSDNLFGAHLDAIGDVLHSHGLMPARYEATIVSGDPDAVVVAISVAPDCDLVALNEELTELQFARGLQPSPYFDVVIGR